MLKLVAIIVIIYTVIFGISSISSSFSFFILYGSSRLAKA